MIPFRTVCTNRGFGLLETLVSVVIASVLVAGAMKMVAAISKSAKLAGAGAEINSLKLEIQTVLSNPAACALALQDSNGNKAKFNPANILPANPTRAQIDLYNLENTLNRVAVGSLNLVQLGQHSGNLSVTSLSLKELDPSLGGNFTSGTTPARRTLTSLEISLEVTKGNPRQVQIPLIVETDLSSTTSKYQILGCSASVAGTSGGSTVTVTSGPGNYYFAHAFRSGAKGSANDIPQGELPINTATNRKVTIMQGPAEAFLVLNDVSPAKGSIFNDKHHTDLDGIKCNEQKGWYLGGCFTYLSGSDSDIGPYPNGCITNDWDGGYKTELSITCIKPR